MEAKTTETPRVVSREEWLTERKALLAREKELTRASDELARQRRALPWVRVEKEYAFEGPKGRETLAQLFDGRSQLIVYHFMLGPGWKEGCVGCSTTTKPRSMWSRPPAIRHSRSLSQGNWVRRLSAVRQPWA